MLDQQMRQFGEGFSIFFEDVELARHTYCIDVLAFEGIVPDLTEEVRDWLWRFTVCKGKSCKGESATIIRLIDELVGLIDADQEHVRKHLDERYEGKVDAKKLLEEWLSALRQIRQVADSKNTCEWHGVNVEKVD
ncbi:MAG: hypothetical protein AAF085_07960 [Planctomycetota bacterium]